MGRTSLRGLIVVGSVLVTCLGATETARACNEPYITASPSSAGPGDTIAWTLGNVEPRASYTVQVAGRTAADDVAGASAPTGTYQIPDLGSSPRDIYVEMSVRHEEPSPSHPEGPSNPEFDSYRVAYQPKVVSEPAPEDPASSSPAPSEPDANGGVGSPGPPANDEAGRKPRDARPRTGVPVRSPASDTESPSKGISSFADEQHPKLAASPVPVKARAAVRSMLHRTQPRGRPHVFVSPGPQPSQRVPAVHAGPQATPTLQERGARGGPLIAGASILFVFLVGFAVWAMRRGGSDPGSGLADGPQWVPPGFGLEAQRSSLLIEAELQELISEERARQMARDAGAVRSGPG